MYQSIVVPEGDPALGVLLPPWQMVEGFADANGAGGAGFTVMVTGTQELAQPVTLLIATA